MGKAYRAPRRLGACHRSKLKTGFRWLLSDLNFMFIKSIFVRTPLGELTSYYAPPVTRSPSRDGTPLPSPHITPARRLRRLDIGSCGMRLYITGPRETGFPESAAALGGIGRWLRTYTSFFKGYGSRKLLVEFLEIKWNERGFNSLLENIRETESTDRRHGSGRPKHECSYKIWSP